MPRLSQSDPNWDAERLVAAMFEAEMRSNTTIFFGVGTFTLCVLVLSILGLRRGVVDSLSGLVLTVLGLTIIGWRAR